VESPRATELKRVPMTWEMTTTLKSRRTVAGHWVVAWYSYDTLEGTIGDDSDILYSIWTDTGDNWDDGSNWTDPQPLNANAASDVGNDSSIKIATDGAGSWVATWSSHDSLDGTIGDDRDVLYSRSTNNGQDWSYPVPLNTNAVHRLGFVTTTSAGQRFRRQLDCRLEFG
jgi:hypothetical protein